ncbi:MAG: DUF4192 domain-containing protein, partial [Propionibacteriaceae bacterium]|nr:DUF4192 domain-containing protein [Propionibacteriaceae bacterium]
LAAAALGPWLDLLLVVDGGRWRLARGPLPRTGGAVPGPLPINAAAERAGLSVAASRAALAAAWAPPRGAREDALIALRQRLAAQLASQPAAGRPALLDDLADRLEAAPRADGGAADPPAPFADAGYPAPFDAGYPAPFTDADYVAAALLAEDPAARSRLWRRLDPAVAPAHLRFWTEVARRCPVGSRLGPVALLGLVAWQAGEGVIMSLCHDEAAALSPADPVVQLLTTVRDQWLPPSIWREAVGALPP